MDGRFLLPISSRQIEDSISIADFFPPNRGFDITYNHRERGARLSIIIYRLSIIDDATLPVTAPISTRLISNIGSGSVSGVGGGGLCVLVALGGG
jgi:hypothetical protein